MMLRLVTVTALGLAAALPSVAFAGDRDGGRPEPARRADEYARGETGGVWVAGHYERREQRHTVPAITREEWVPDRYEEVVIPAVTQEFRIPAVTERIHCPAVTERCWVPEVTERCFVPGRYEVQVDRHGRSCRVWVAAHYETRVVRAGHYEERVIKPAHWDVRVVQPERCEVRVVVPARCERRLVERAHCRTVIVRPARTEVTYENVWVPGCWERRAPEGRPHDRGGRNDRDDRTGRHDRDDDRDDRSRVGPGRVLASVLDRIGNVLLND